MKVHEYLIHACSFLYLKYILQVTIICSFLVLLIRYSILYIYLVKNIFQQFMEAIFIYIKPIKLDVAPMIFYFTVKNKVMNKQKTNYIYIYIVNLFFTLL